MTNTVLEWYFGYPTVIRDWMDAGGVLRDVVELLHDQLASEACSDLTDCKTDKEGWTTTTCSLVGSRYYYDFWYTPADKDYPEWIHEYFCCCIDEEVDPPDGGPTTGPGEDEPV